MVILQDSGQSSKLECDYDTNPTELYQAIEARPWEHTLNLWKNSNSNENKVSFKKQANTWVVRKEIGGKLRWRMLPLHAVMIFKSPYKVVEAIFLAAPNCVHLKDDRGMVPLHLAFRHEAPDDVINIMITSSPSIIEVKDRKGRIPLECASIPGKQTSRKLLENYIHLVVASERQKVSEKLNVEYDRKMDVLRKAYEQEIAGLKKKVTNAGVEVRSARTACNAMLSRVTNMGNIEKKLYEEIEGVRSEKFEREETIATIEQKINIIYSAVAKNMEEKKEALSLESKIETIKEIIRDKEEQYERAIQVIAEKDDSISSLYEQVEKADEICRTKEEELGKAVRKLNEIQSYAETRKKETSVCKEMAEECKKKSTNLMGTVQNLTNRNSNLEEELEVLRKKVEDQAVWLQNSSGVLDKVMNIVCKENSTTWNIREEMAKNQAKDGFEMQLIAERERKIIMDIITNMKQDLDKVLHRPKLCTSSDDAL